MMPDSGPTCPTSTGICKCHTVEPALGQGPPCLRIKFPGVGLERTSELPQTQATVLLIEGFKLILFEVNCALP